MSRCIRQIDNDFYIVFCNTSDIVFPFMFTDIETAKRFVFEWDNHTKLSYKFCASDNPISMETIKEYEEEQ